MGLLADIGAWLYDPTARETDIIDPPEPLLPADMPRKGLQVRACKAVIALDREAIESAGKVHTQHGLEREWERGYRDGLIDARTILASHLTGKHDD